MLFRELLNYSHVQIIKWRRLLCWKFKQNATVFTRTSFSCVLKLNGVFIEKTLLLFHQIVHSNLYNCSIALEIGEITEKLKRLHKFHAFMLKAVLFSVCCPSSRIKCLESIHDLPAMFTCDLKH